MTDAPDPGPLTPEDLAALAAVRRGNDWLRAVLHTLARRGAAVRLRQPDRAQALSDALGSWPLYKAGQFLFDLMEWEDFIVDGPPPAPIGSVLDSQALGRLARSLRALRAHLDGEPGTGSPDGGAAVPGLAASLRDDDLPPLEPGFHLYRDVVLGAIVSAGVQLVEPLPPS